MFDSIAIVGATGAVGAELIRCLEERDFPAASLHEIATGDSRQLPEDGWNAGWTPDGHALQLSGNEVFSCTAIAQDCTTIGEVDDPDSVRLAEAYYGS